MFEFLKDKLKQVVSKFTRKIEEEAKPVEVDSPKGKEPAKDQPKRQLGEPQIEKQKPEPKLEKLKSEPEKEEKKETPKPVPESKREAPKPQPEPASKIERPVPIEKEELVKPAGEIRKPIAASILQPESKDQPKTQAVEPTKEIKELPKAASEPQKEEKRTFFGLFKKKEEQVHKPEPTDEPPEKLREEPEIQLKEEQKEAKKNLFEMVREKVTRQTINESQFEDMFSELEMALLENNVALEVIDKIKLDLKAELVNKPLERGKVNAIIESSLRKTIEELFEIEGIDLLKRISQKKPFIICFVGINGSGKTTTIAKLAHLLKKHKLSSVMAAGDTFRAAAIQQLEVHADKLGIKLIKHDYGSDSAAVAYDAISHAKAHNIDVVLIDTAGRLHSNANLMDEIKKVKRVTQPDLVIFVGESITGNDCVEQAKSFNEQLGIDAIILAKSDVDEKGGAAISISYITKKPIMYLGTGQGYDDLIEFDPKLIVKSLGLGA